MRNGRIEDRGPVSRERERRCFAPCRPSSRETCCPLPTAGAISAHVEHSPPSHPPAGGPPHGGDRADFRAHRPRSTSSSPTASDMEGYLVEQRGLFRGATPAVVRPGSTEEVAFVVKTCAEAGIPIVPQGGNTGLVGGQVPFGALLLSLGRLNKVPGARCDRPDADRRGRLHAPPYPAGGGCGGLPLPALHRHPKDLPDRRQPRHQCGRHRRSALRKYP